MALQYGYGMYEDTYREPWTRKYQALSDHDKKVYHEMLPSILLMTDIGIILPETIPSIRDRLLAKRPALYQELCEAAGADLDPKIYLERFIGYQANVTTLSTVGFVKRWMDSLKNRIPKLTPKDLMTLNVEDALINELTQEELPLLVNKRWSCERTRQKYHKRFSDTLNKGPGQ